MGCIFLRQGPRQIRTHALFQTECMYSCQVPYATSVGYSFYLPQHVWAIANEWLWSTQIQITIAAQEGAGRGSFEESCVRDKLLDNLKTPTILDIRRVELGAANMFAIRWGWRMFFENHTSTSSPWKIFSPPAKRSAIIQQLLALMTSFVRVCWVAGWPIFGYAPDPFLAVEYRWLMDRQESCLFVIACLPTAGRPHGKLSFWSWAALGVDVLVCSPIAS